jgi:hypothetical protein
MILKRPVRNENLDRAYLSAGSFSLAFARLRYALNDLAPNLFCVR